MNTESFLLRHLGPRPSDLPSMLEAVGVDDLDQLIGETVPASIRIDDPLGLPDAMSEREYLDHVQGLAGKNRVGTCFIGQGYYGCITPPVIQRNLIENPGWYTPYTPYQAEIAQGRLESLLNFQTMVSDLTGMDAANASLLDEGTAAAEAMAMMHRLVNRRARSGQEKNVLGLSCDCFHQTAAVVRGRAEPLGIEVLSLTPGDPVPENCFGVILQNPDADGGVRDLSEEIQAIHAAGAMAAVACDLLALTLIVPPGEQGADIAFGSAQRFGVPMMYGGPHAAFFATREKLVREMPGRIIGVSQDRDGRTAYRMSLQTREQHIRREKAKSNICTAQALLANIAAMYAVYHGPEGLRAIAERVHGHAMRLKEVADRLGIEVLHEVVFDTLTLRMDPAVFQAAAPDDLWVYPAGDMLRLSIDEHHREEDLVRLADTLARAAGQGAFGGLQPVSSSALPESLQRKSGFLEHPVFHRYRSETEMMRYLRSLERKDLGLDAAMIPLGSCTMKLNSASEMMPITWPGFTDVHPFQAPESVAGYREVMENLSRYLQKITGFAGVSLQPNSGAQGEFAGLMTIRAWHISRGEGHRKAMLIPGSAHGTNPASAVMAGMDVVVVGCDQHGNVDVDDLRAKAEAHAANLAGLMITYPSTHGVFEDAIQEICSIIHQHGGQVYLDGANLNAQVGLTHPGIIGADVCHMNLHKTFGIPHGGGGPGMGPIAVAEHLVPFLPGHPDDPYSSSKQYPVSAAPFGSASILLISYGYIRMLGEAGCREATRMAILNANYIKARIESVFPVLYTNRKGRVAHELIVDLRPFKESAGVTEEDVAKRLMDYSFHAPTVSWPVPGTIMIEPTESESREELDRFCDALLQIREEIRDIEEGRVSRDAHLLNMAPHPAEVLVQDTWNRPYSREQAAYPVEALRSRKHWPSIARIDNAHGDRNLVCSCPPMAAYRA